MKVESVAAFPLRVKASERLVGGSATYDYLQTVLVRATADGVVGWGEAMTRYDPRATSSLIEHLGSALVHKEFAGPQEAWNSIWKDLRTRGHTRGTDIEALSGIEIALWDCQGKIAKTTVSRMLSADTKNKVDAFAGSIFDSRGTLEAQVERVRSGGLKGTKVKIGFGVRKDAETLRLVRELWPDGMLVADANGSYDEGGALSACRAFRKFDLAWFEEPVPSNDWEGYRALRDNGGVKIGAGESWFVDDFWEPINSRLVGVVEPSVSRCGGIGLEKRVGDLAAQRNLEFSPMTGMNSAVSLAASIHVAGATNTLGVEFNPFSNPLQENLLLNEVPLEGGRFSVPDGPGLGISVDESFVIKNRLD